MHYGIYLGVPVFTPCAAFVPQCGENDCGSTNARGGIPALILTDLVFQQQDAYVLK